MKQIKSPSKKWAGYVVLHDPLVYEHVKAIDDALDKSSELDASALLSQRDDDGKITIKMNWVADTDYLRIAAICKCVSEWHLENFPPEVNEKTFPMSPRLERQKLVSWLWDELQTIYEGELEVPNVS